VSSRLGYEPGLDGVRALSVLAVIAYHAGYGWGRGGFLGVDAFFVLSGFLITTLLLLEFRARGTIALGQFWARRARRLLPALLIVLVFVALFTATVMPAVERAKVRGDGLSALFYVANWRFIFSGQSYFDLFSGPSPLRHLWSLAIEEQFYLVWPLAVLACLRLGRSLRLLAGVTIGGAAVSAVAMAVLHRTEDPSRAYYGTDCRGHTLLVGALLAIILVVRPPGHELVSHTLGALGFVSLAGVVWAWHDVAATSRSYYEGGSLLYAVAVAIVVAGAMQPGPLKAVLSFPVLVWLGRLSYGLYLWHWPVDVWLSAGRTGLAGTPLNALRLGMTLAAATVSYYLVEQPIRHGWLRHRITWKAAVAAVAATAVAMVTSTAGAAEPPSYVAAFGQPSPCEEPRPVELRAARAANARSSEPSLRGQEGTRLLLIGDSTACSLYPGLRAVGESSGIEVRQAAVVGCGVASGEIVSARHDYLPLGTKVCPGLVEKTVSRGLHELNPDVVVWMSVWEKSDLVVDGRTVAAGTPERDAEMLARMGAALHRLTRKGARVVLVTEAPHAPGRAFGQELKRSTAVDDAEFAGLNQLLRRFARGHADETVIVDLAAKLCPAGSRCPERVEGIRPRPDGAHFDPPSAVWAARWLLKEIGRARHTSA